MRICNYCGRQNESESAKCSECGSDLTSELHPPRQLGKGLDWTLSSASAASWWVLAIWMQQSGAAGEYVRFAPKFGLLSIAGLLISAVLRSKPSAILAWLPVSLCIAAFTGWSITQALSFRSVPGTFDGLAAIVYLGSALAGAVLGLVALLTRPRTVRNPVLVVSTANCVAVLAFATLINGSPSGEPHYLTVLSPDGRPLADAEVRYNVFGYGEGGGRPTRPVARGGPMLTSSSGEVAIYAEQIRRDIEGTVTKQGFRPVTFLLRMQYYKGDASRDLWWGTGPMGNYDQREANCRNLTTLSTKPPLRLVVYLPEASQLPERLLRYEFHRRITPDTGLNLAEAQFLPLNRADISFDFVPNPGSTNHESRLRLTGLRGAQLQIIPKIKLEPPALLFDYFWLRAPDRGYSDSVEITERGHREGQVFVRCPGNRVYSRLFVSGSQNTVDALAYVNTNGSPWLEFDPKLKVEVNHKVQ